MKRRAMLKALMAAGAAASGFRLPLVHAADDRGKLFVFVQADGGWDPTSFCDPKANTPGEPVINHWAESDEVRQIGRLRYAPFASNEAFFRKYHRRMLVINGVDAQTNSHTVGDRAQLERPELRGVSDDDGAARCALRAGAAGTVPELRRVLGDLYNTLRRQAQLAVLAFKTGVAVSADLWLGGFDTHADHDPDHEWLLGNLTDSVDFLWEYAEEHGVADRLVVVIGSDFGRTNFYNAQSGKDHWPIGSLRTESRPRPDPQCRSCAA